MIVINTDENSIESVIYFVYLFINFPIFSCIIPPLLCKRNMYFLYLYKRVAIKRLIEKLQWVICLYDACVKKEGACIDTV